MFLQSLSVAWLATAANAFSLPFAQNKNFVPVLSSSECVGNLQNMAHPWDRLIELGESNTGQEGTIENEKTVSSTKDQVNPELTEEDWMLIDELSSTKDVDMNNAVTVALPKMHPRLLMKLRKAVDIDTSAAVLSEVGAEKMSKLKSIGSAVAVVLDTRLQKARDVLAELLRCEEIRKLDSFIGRASKSGQLDMAFFTVLNMNIRDATYEASQVSKEGKEESEKASGADRLQILQHIYTRSQEEVEKIISPGAGLLNKLLRTEIPSIRENQIRHYLGPQAKTLTTPDGQTIELKGQRNALVPPSEFTDVLANAVKQIRTLEKAGGTDRVTAAGLVESCRQLAIDARKTIAEVYGTESQVLKDFEEQLQPVFRPESTESQYISGD